MGLVEQDEGGGRKITREGMRELDTVAVQAAEPEEHGFCIGHITPEAQVGGPIALVQDGDPIRIDARSEARTIDLLISDEEWEARQKAWSPPPLRASQGTLFKYIQNVATASGGCVTDEVLATSNVVTAAAKTPAVAELDAKIADLEAQLKQSV